MGLEILDMSFQLERRFKIELPLDQFRKTTTVENVCEWVAAALPQETWRNGSRVATFFRLRSHLFEQCGCLRGEVRPRSSLKSLFRRRRRKRWDALCGFDSRIPPLQASSLLRSLRGIGLACVAVGTLFGVLNLARESLALAVVGGVVGLALCEIIYRLTVFLERDLPAEVESIWSVVEICAPLPDRRAREYLMMEVRRIIAEATGLPLEKIRPESELIRDLNMG